MARSDWVDGRKLVGLAVGGLGAIVVALVLVPFREDIDNANLALAPFHWPLPRLERSGAIEASEHQWSSGGYMLPEYGVQLPVLRAGAEVARLVLMGDPEVSVTLEERVVAVALADQLGSAFAMAGPIELERVQRELARDDS